MRISFGQTDLDSLEIILDDELLKQCKTETFVKSDDIICIEFANLQNTYISGKLWYR